MQISLHTDYALRVLMYLAIEDERKASIEEMARAYDISENHLVKVVHRLGQLGLVATRRGRGGGVSLGAPAETINIGETIRKIERLDLLECFEPKTSSCPLTGICALRSALRAAQDAFLKTLAHYTLKDITKNPLVIAKRLSPSST